MGREELKAMEEALSLITGEVTILHEEGGEVVVNADASEGDPVKLALAILNASADGDVEE